MYGIINKIMNKPSCEHSPFKFYTQISGQKRKKLYHKVPNLPNIRRFQKISTAEVSSKNTLLAKIFGR